MDFVPTGSRFDNFSVQKFHKDFSSKYPQLMSIANKVEKFKELVKKDQDQSESYSLSDFHWFYSCDGLGLPLLVWAASSEERKLEVKKMDEKKRDEKKMEVLMGNIRNELEFDMRGRISVIRKKSVHIELGEIKTNMTRDALHDVKKQLRLRLSALQFSCLV